LLFATSNTYSGQAVPYTNLVYIPSEETDLNGIDAVFLALPHKASAVVAAQALQAGVKVIDLSADFRMNTPEAYEQWYHSPHPHPELLPVPYGLPEINRASLQNIDL